MFETVVRVDKPRKNVIIPTLEEDLDGLGYLQGKDVDFVNKKATDGVLQHKSGMRRDIRGMDAGDQSGDPSALSAAGCLRMWPSPQAFRAAMTGSSVWPCS